MPRRTTVNRTRIDRIERVPAFDAWVGFVCLRCSTLNHVRIGLELLNPQLAFENAKWECQKCHYVHSKKSNLPFQNWPKSAIAHRSLPAQRFWIGFFRTATEHASSYWKQCNACGRVLPFQAFSKHSAWGPLELQMECRSCKGGINAVLNPLRTAEQMQESAVRRRVADLLLRGVNKPIKVEDLFRRFQSKCFKCSRKLDPKIRSSWAIDHILPSRYLYPLKLENSALLCTDCNNKKRDRWPSEFYTNNQMIKLSQIAEADLELLASKTPIVNLDIDVDACVSRYLSVREGSNLGKRILGLRKLLTDYQLIDKLSAPNKKLLGFK